MDLGHSFAGGALGEVVTDYEGPFLSELLISSHPLITAPTDPIPNRQAYGSLTGGGVISRRINTQNGLYSGLVETTVGELEIVNTTGEFDEYLTYASDGRPLEILVGEAYRNQRGGLIAPAMADMYSAIKVTGGAWAGDLGLVRLAVRDAGINLQRPISEKKYKGTGQDEGPEAMKDLTKPIVIGAVQNIEPVLIEPGTLIYQVHDGPVAAFLGVYDSGVVIPVGGVSGRRSNYGALRDAYVPPGKVMVCEPRGMFKLGTTPAGRLTCDVVGVAGDSVPILSGFSDGTKFSDDSMLSFTSTAGGLIKQILTTFGGIESEQVDHAAFSAFDALQAGQIGYYIAAGEEVTTEKVLVDMTQGAGAIVSTGQDGRYFLRRVDPPEWFTPDRTFTTDDIESIRRESPAYGAPWREIVLDYRKNWTLMGKEEVAPSVEDSRKVYLTKEGLQKTQYHNAAAAAHKSSSTLKIQSYFWHELEAQNESARLTQLYAVGRAEYVVIFKTALFNLDIGSVVALRLDRFGLDNGKNFVVVATTDDPGRDETEARLFG